MSGNEERRFELTASLAFPLLAPERLHTFATDLDRAVYEAAREHPTITAYFVSVDENEGTIAVGLRFEGMDPRYIEGTADDVIDEAVSAASGGQPMRTVREESALVPA
ncbi:hypothetical protein [Microbacterium testaceum]|uniref:Uncharacterized protein n=1 Tax=Microbacterium testaceum TaxID=2033 RepID=A0A147FD36_MICTE|nr:hypothetical protein [Microbacterium testaceum]KTS14402.1 hypothetical protein RSA3_00390 [Microbacterium testaceum]